MHEQLQDFLNECIDTKFKRAFLDIHQRCNNPKNKNYVNYWWRWVKCEWLQFEDFKKDMYASFVEHNKIHWWIDTSINRIDNNWNYCKANCNWITFKEQQNNRRSNYVVEWKTIQERSEELWIPKWKLRHRVKNMWMSIKEAREYVVRNKSWVQWIVWSNTDNRRIVQRKENWKVKRKYFKSLDDAKYFLDNALLPEHNLWKK